MKRLAVIVPALNESRRVKSVMSGLRAILAGLASSDVRVVMVLVDDGSQDGTFERFERELPGTGITAKLIRFSRNFGKDSAVFAGLQETQADFYVIVDADGQTPYSLVPEMYRLIDAESVEVVYAVKSREPYGWLRRSLTGLFYVAAHRLGIWEMKKGSSDFMLFSRLVRDRIVSMGEKEIVVRNAVRWMGLSSREIPFEPGKSDTTAFSLTKLLTLGLRSLLSFSHILRINFFIALGYWVFSFFYAIMIIHNKLTGRIHEGLSTTTLLALISFGLLFFMIAIIGEYLIVLFEEVKKRPRFVIDRIRDIEGE